MEFVLTVDKSVHKRGLARAGVSRYGDFELSGLHSEFVEKVSNLTKVVSTTSNLTFGYLLATFVVVVVTF